jgi:hypothetical protein
MKLSEMVKPSAKKINNFMESRFGFTIDYRKMTIDRARELSETIDENLHKIRNSVALHTAEKNPRYMELLTVRESLTQWLDTQRRSLTEGEVGNAEVLLAAKDMVDSVQDMIERVGKMQNEQLPQLLDSIRDQIGSEQADGFKNAVGSTLTTIMGQLGSARDGVDKGVRILSGEAVDQPMDLGAPSDITPPPTSDLDLDAGLDSEDETDGFVGTNAAVGGQEELGRDLR